MRFTALLHHVTVERLHAAFRTLSKGAAAGVDGVTWEQYAGQLEENIRALHGRLHQGAYRAKPSRRAYIPKADGRQRRSELRRWRQGGSARRRRGAQRDL